jgi:hypothetical protein
VNKAEKLIAERQKFVEKVIRFVHDLLNAEGKVLKHETHSSHMYSLREMEYGGFRFRDEGSFTMFGGDEVVVYFQGHQRGRGQGIRPHHAMPRLADAVEEADAPRCYPDSGEDRPSQEEIRSLVRERLANRLGSESASEGNGKAEVGELKIFFAFPSENSDFHGSM